MNKFILTFPNNYFYYNCFSCNVNCCSFTKGILNNKNFNSNYSNNFTFNNIILSPQSCVYLNNNKCLIEREQGKDKKPEICNLFPYIILGKINNNYVLALDFHNCTMREKGENSLSLDNFLYQNKFSNFENYKNKIKINFLIPKNILNFSFYDYFSLFYNIDFKLIKKYWYSWNNYFEKNIKINKNIPWFITGFDSSYLVNPKDRKNYINLTGLEKLSLIYYVFLFEEISNKKITSYSFFRLLNSSLKSIKLLSVFFKNIKLKKNINLNSPYFNELLEFYYHSKNKMVYESLKLIKTTHKGNIINEISNYFI